MKQKQKNASFINIHAQKNLNSTAAQPLLSSLNLNLLP